MQRLVKSGDDFSVVDTGVEGSARVKACACSVRVVLSDLDLSPSPSLCGNTKNAVDRIGTMEDGWRLRHVLRYRGTGGFSSSGTPAAGR